MSDVDPEKVVRMYDVELMAIRDIAKRLGVSYGAVQRIVSTYTTPRQRGHRTNDGKPPPCGSKNAYQRHLDRGEEPDEPCKQANRDYTNEFNRRTGISRARNRAYRRLAKAFPDIFDALLIEERDKAKEERLGIATKTWSSRTRERAHRRLTELHPDIFEQIFTEERHIASDEQIR